MLIFTKILDLQGFLEAKRNSGLTVGFVPTMGALHEGHLSLIQESRKVCGVTVCSIFVNPTQFNDKQDLKRYPRTPEIDTSMLEQAKCDALFIPAVEEIYPQETVARFDFGQLDKVLEGAHRPGHFNGVAQVVKRFFEIIKPDMAFFGSKDYQQVLIVKALVRQMNAGIKIVACPTLRDTDGLAKSSRNALLSETERKVAGLIPGMMQQAGEIAIKSGIDDAKIFIREKVSANPLMKLDYYEVCDPDNLNSITEIKQQQRAISLIAVFVGKTRLIDNLILN